MASKPALYSINLSCVNYNVTCCSIVTIKNINDITMPNASGL